MNNNLFFALLCVLFIAGCSSEGRRIKSESGYEYQVVQKGSNEPIPVNSYVFLNLTVTLKDSLTQKDTVLQSSVQSGGPIPVKITEDNKNFGRYKPLFDVIATLHLGDSLRFFFPLDSLGPTPPNYAQFQGPMIYNIGISKLMSEDDFKTYSDSIQQSQEAIKQIVRDRFSEVEAKTKATWESYKKGQLEEQIKRTDTGLGYIIIEEGAGPKPVKDELVSVHYFGILAADGKKFDSSFERGESIQFPLGTEDIIQGWNQGISLMNKGSKATLFIPSELAYGAGGRPPVIPENSELIFYIELE